MSEQLSCHAAFHKRVKSQKQVQVPFVPLFLPLYACRFRHSEIPQVPHTERLLLLQVRFFLHAPLQLATVLLAAATAQHMCTAVQTSTSGAACLSLIGVQQLVLGLLIPSFLTFMLDFRVGTAYMPHIQAKSWAVIPS